MKVTSAEANKLLKKLSEDYENTVLEERNSRRFVAATTEDIETVRPEYDYGETKKKLDDLAAKIRRVKHAINVFNTTHKVKGYDMTIDEVLVYIPQLSSKKQKLSGMMNVLPKERDTSRVNGNIIDYVYANYDIKEAARDFDAVSVELSNVQTALDVMNNSVKFDIDIDI